MVATGPQEVFGSTCLADHFNYLAGKGGVLDEIDSMTTTTGVLGVSASDKLKDKKFVANAPE